MKLSNSNDLTPHQENIKAEKTLISLTLDLTPFEVSIFLANYGISREEYNYLLSKYSRLIEAYKEGKLNE